jgi:hypothetical protein
VTKVLLEAGASLSAVDNEVIKPSVKLIQPYCPQQTVRPLPPLEPLSPLCIPSLLPGVEVSGPKTIVTKVVVEAGASVSAVDNEVIKHS